MKTLAAVFLCVTICSGAGTAAEDSTAEVGLVLGGGGARGFAHIGVLKVLEELRIPVDYVAGTSAGAIIGALYAAGLSPSRIEVAVHEIDWVDLFSDQVRRTERVYRRKQDDRADLFDMELGLRGFRPALPRGAIAGQKLALAFKLPELHTSVDQDFDDLPIPYRAVATDINTGEMVVISSGSLIHAVRASMSIPGLFSPVRIDGRLLVDGGLVRNVPADVPPEMGAEVVIVVDVGNKGKPGPDGVRDMVDIANRSLSVMIEQASREAVERADVVIRVEMPEFNSLDYLRIEEIIDAGEEAARGFVDALSEYSVSEARYDDFLASHRQARAEPRTITSVELENESRVDGDVILRRVTIEPGDTLDLDALDENLHRVYGLGMFEVVDFELHKRPTGNALRIRAFEKPFAPHSIRIGWDYIDDLNGRLEAGYLARHTLLEVNRLGGELRTDVRLSQSRHVATECYQPLDTRRATFVSAHAVVFYRVQDMFVGDTRVAELRRQGFSYGFDLGGQFWRFGEMRSGLDWGETTSDVRSGVEVVMPRYRKRGAWVSRLRIDTLDDAHYPRSGLSAHAMMYAARPSLGDFDRYEKLSADATQFLSVGRNTVFLSAAGGSDLGSEVPFDDQFVIGGPQSFSGFRPGHLRGELFAVSRLGYYRQLVEGKVLFGYSLYAGAWAEVGNVWNEVDDVAFDDVFYTGTIALGATTILGPVQVGYGRADIGYDSYFLTVGRQFGTQSGLDL